MATRGEPSNSENVYFNDPENVAEMARLLGQDRLITKGMGGSSPSGLIFPASTASSMLPVVPEVGRWRSP